MAEEQGAAEELRVRAWREHRRLSISELARQSGISRMTVVRIERGDERAVRGAALERLARALGATVYELRREPVASGDTGQEPGVAVASEAESDPEPLAAAEPEPGTSSMVTSEPEPGAGPGGPETP